MARFIEIKQKSNRVFLLNTDYVMTAEYCDRSNDAPLHSVILATSKNERTDFLYVDFETKEDAMEFLQVEFLIFNS